MHLKPHNIHIWQQTLTASSAQEEQAFSLLNAEEKQRANRLHFPLHRKRFILAHSGLRRVLSHYVETSPEEIKFTYNAHGKPFLAPASLQFNLAHSDDQAVLAITQAGAIGIDIEKIQDHYQVEIPARFFSTTEQQVLNQLAEKEQIPAFYRLWARKEAILKAMGKGLSIPLASFSVSEKDLNENVILEETTWSIMPLTIYPGYAGAVATNQVVNQIDYHIIKAT